MAMHIAIAGNIGAGKTTLTHLLAKHYDWDMQLEDMDDNPYISDFYEDMQRWRDRTIYEDAHIFAPNLHAMGLMSTRDYENYNALFENINQQITPPDLLIYLRAGIPKLVHQIQMRGRDYEDAIRLDYLKRLNERYEAWISEYKGKLLVFNVDDMDFSDNPDHAAQIVQQVESTLNGLF